MGVFTEKELDHITSTMEVFCNTTNLPCVLTDEVGKIILSEGNARNFCSRIWSIEGGESRCTHAHEDFGKQSLILGEAYISYCPAGLVHYSAAIKVGDVYKGAIIVGPVHMSEPDIYELDQFISRSQINLNEKALLKTYYNNIPLIAPTTARYHLQLLNLLIHEIVDDSKKDLQKKKARYDEQRIINEAVQELKDIENMSQSTGEKYPIHLEKELNSAIIKGDEQSAKALLNEILGFVFFKYMGDTPRIISKCMELIVVMSRGAVEGGASYECVANITDNMYLKATQSEGIEEICAWLLEVLEQFIRIIFPMNTEKDESTSIVRKAVIYMNNNLYENITLEQVADEVGLSPTYFSKVFKSEMNMKFIEYLNRIRIEESKKYLVDTSQSMSDIALRIGFTDQSYFSKVFKKYEGMTPGKYRKMY